jgi:predicted DNA-binding protein
MVVGLKQEKVGGRVLTSLSLAPGQRERLAAVAARLGRNRSSLVRDLIERLLRKYEVTPPAETGEAS